MKTFIDGIPWFWYFIYFMIWFWWSFHSWRIKKTIFSVRFIIWNFIFPNAKCTMLFDFLCPCGRWLQQGTKDSSYVCTMCKTIDDLCKIQQKRSYAEHNCLEKIKRLHINSALTQVVEMQIKNWLGSAEHSDVMLYFRFDFPCWLSSLDVFSCVKSCINETDIHAVFSYWQYGDIFYREPTLSLLEKNPLFSIQVLRERKSRNPLRSSFFENHRWHTRSDWCLLESLAASS